MTPRVASLARSGVYSFSKACVPRLRFVAGHGIEGDVHAGPTVKHRSRVAADPTRPNLRQVHLIPGELLDTLKAEGFAVSPGRLGENVLTEGVDLFGLPTGARLALGDEAVLVLTGLRNPCRQLDDVGAGLMKRLIERRPDGRIDRRAGVMAIVERGGGVECGAEIRVTWPAAPHHVLEKV